MLRPEAPGSWRGLDLAAERVIGRVAGRFDREGICATVLGDPRLALGSLANEPSRHGLRLAAGAVVTTGTCLVPLEIAPGDSVTAELGPLGAVPLRLVRPPAP